MHATAISALTVPATGRPRALRSYPPTSRRVRLAHERHGAYDPAPSGSDGSLGAGTAEPPFGLPVLAEVPTLAAVLDRLRVADGALLDAVAGLADLLADDTVERTTGVGIEHWLAVVGAQTRMDRRLLVRACRLLRRLPTLDAAVRDHRISFAQLRGLTIGLRNLKTALDGQLDPLLGALLDGLDEFERPDPDVLVDQVIDAIDELDADEFAERERGATDGRFLHLQPRLDGTGGRIFGDLDAAGLALLDAATTPPAELLNVAGGSGAARIDTLLARLAGPCDETAHHEDGGDWWDRLTPPQLLIRLPLRTLLDEQLPADLLTTLTGGRLRLTSATARQLLDRAGARLRSIVIDDDGTVLGVGRASRQPPGWLSDAVAAVHDTCSGPGCDRSARGVQIDHARPWWPARPDTSAGTTDLDNLGPLCATTNRAKESAGWQVTQTTGGTRTWTHPRSGLATTTVPSTWRPHDDPRRRPPPRPAPPGPHGAGPGRPASPSDPVDHDLVPPDWLPF